MPAAFLSIGYGELRVIWSARLIDGIMPKGLRKGIGLNMGWEGLNKMKIKMQTKVIESGYVLNEEYDVEKGENPEKFARNLIDNFNNTLRPNESPRELISVDVIDHDSMVLHNHSWRKANSVTVVRGGSNYDIMRCERCGITGKRHGIGNATRRDSIFKGKCYEKCETALAQMQKNKQRITGGGPEQ